MSNTPKDMVVLFSQTHARVDTETLSCLFIYVVVPMMRLRAFLLHRGDYC